MTPAKTGCTFVDAGSAAHIAGKSSCIFKSEKDIPAMKKSVVLLIIILSGFGVHAQVSITLDSSPADPSAMLDVKSTDKGILIPRMTAIERDSISSPANGLLVYVTTDSSFYFFEGTAWSKIGRVGWSLNGNTATNPATNFLGTTDDVPLIFRTNNTKALRLSYADVDLWGLGAPPTPAPNLIGGFSGNNVDINSAGSTIGGGGTTNAINSISAIFGTISGGALNLVSNNYATIGGGFQNSVTNLHATVSGGFVNTASGSGATIAGGFNNTAIGHWSAISGGKNNVAGGNEATISGGESNSAIGINSAVTGGTHNTASGYGSTVVGGEQNGALGSHASVIGGQSNSAKGDYSIASGYRAKIDSIHDGTFLFADHKPFNFNSIQANEFAVRATGGFRFVPAIDGTGNPMHTVSIDNSGTVAATAFVGDGSGLTGIPDDQTLSITGNMLSIENGNSVNLPGDNLGNHTATSDINLNDNWLSNGIADTGLKIDTTGMIYTKTNLSTKLGLQIETNDSPGIRFHQVYTGGWAEQYWDIITNETSFSIRDFTNSLTTPFKIYTGAQANRIVVKDENVGIGVTNPSELLDVDGKIRMREGAVNGYIPISDANGVMTWTNPSILAQPGDNLGNHAATQNLKLNGHYLSGDGDNEGLFISGNGNVGISTTIPASKFNVVCPQNGSSLKVVDWPVVDSVQVNTELVGNNAGSQLRFTNSGTASFTDIGQTKNGGFAVEVNDIQRMVINNAGNVGLNTASPTANLDVNGSVRLRGGSPGIGKVLTSDTIGNATWQTLANIPATYYTKTTNVVTYNNDDNWQSITNQISIPWQNGDVVKIEGMASLRLTSGNGVDQFEMRVRLDYGSCGSVYTNTFLYTPGESAADHDNVQAMPYLDMFTLDDCSAGSLSFTLEVRNTGDDAWEAQDRVLVITKL